MRALANPVRLILAALAVLLFSFSASAAGVTYVGGAVSTSSSTASSSCAVTYSPTAGNTVVGWAAGVGVDVSSVADNATGGSSTYTRLTAANNHTVDGSLWGVLVVKSGVTTITFTMASSTRRACGVVEFSGVAAFGNSEATGTGSSTSPQGSVTTQDSNNYIVVGMSTEGTSTWATHSGVGTLEKSLVGAGSTTPGVGLSINNSASAGSVTAGATLGTSGTWIASGIELRNNAPVAMTETVGPAADTLTGNAQHQVALAVTVSESDSCLACKNPIGFTEGNVTVDALSINLGVSMTDAVSESDSVSEAATQFGAITQSVGPASDTLTGNAQHQKAVSETVSESDSVAGSKTSAHTASMTETLSPSNSLTGNAQHQEAMTEMQTTTPSILAQKVTNWTAAMTENLSTNGGILTAHGNLAPLTETVTESDSCSASHCNPVPITEGNVTTDLCTALKTTGTCHPVGFTEGNVTTDALTAAGSSGQSVNANVTETVHESDSCNGVRCHPSGMTEGAVTVDAVGAVKSTHNAVMSETVTESDSVTVAQCIQFPAEFLTESDSVATQHAAVGVMQESLFTSDNAAEATPNRAVLLTETHTTNDAVTGPAEHQRSMAETLTTTAAITNQSAHVASMTDSVAVSDSIAASHNANQYAANMSEALSVSDALSNQSLHFANMFEALTESDAAAGPRNVHGAMTENLTTSAVPSWQTGKGMIETLTTVDQLTAFASHSGGLTENLVTSDSVAALHNHAQWFANMVEFPLQQEFFEDFTSQPDSNPLPSPWVRPVTMSPLQIMGGQVVSANPAQFLYYGGNYYNSTLSPNQYAQITIGSLFYDRPPGSTSLGSNEGAFVRFSSTAGYYAAFAETVNVGQGYPIIFLEYEPNVGAPETLGYYQGPVNTGDVLRITALTSNIYVTLNGKLIISAVDTHLTSGFAGMFLFADQTLNSATIYQFAAGDAVPADAIATTAQWQAPMLDSVVESDSLAASKASQWFANMVESLITGDLVQARPPSARKRFMIIQTQ